MTYEKLQEKVSKLLDDTEEKMSNFIVNSLLYNLVVQKTYQIDQRYLSHFHLPYLQ